MLEDKLKRYYNKFNEDKRLETRHGKVEFLTTTKYILDLLKEFKNPKILDLGAGTGKYSIFLKERGYDVSAVELVKHNLKVIESKCKDIELYLGNALDLSMLGDKKYELILLFGPIYHLFREDKIKAILEAKKHLADHGYLMIVYCLNDFALIKHGFLEENRKEIEEIAQSNFKIKDKEEHLYTFDTLEDIDTYNKLCDLKRVKIISQEGFTEYMRPTINKMSKEEFDLYLKFHLCRCENLEYLGLSRHALDIVKVTRN